MSNQTKENVNNMDGPLKLFDKFLLLRNIRFLLKTSNVMVSQIEKMAGCQIGYMSRLEKADSSQEPSLAFAFAASKLLDISVNILLTTDITKLTSTELYILKMIDKLKEDTISDRVEWNEHSFAEYNDIVCDINGNVQHPLFDYSRDDNVNYHSNIVFVSHMFGYNTEIRENCYSLALKNRSYLYLMSASKSKVYSSDEITNSEEIWLYVPNSGNQYIASSNDDNPIGEYVSKLFDVLRKHFSHPVIKKSFKSILDSYMNDDFGDDNNDELPF